MSARAIGNGGGRWWLSAYVIAYIIFLYLPVALIPLFSFNNSIQAAFPLMGFTFEWYRTLAGDEALQNALLNSLIVGLSAATIATLCGITIAYMDVFVRTPLASVISAIARLPILIPGIIIGIALLILVNLAGVGPSRLAIIAGHILTGLPTTVVIMRGRFAAIPRTIPEAAEDLGAREARIFFRILLPLSLPAIGSAFMLAFLTSFDEFIIAFFLSGTEQTLPIYIWSQLRFPKSLPIVMALGTVILATSVVIVAIAEWLRQRGHSAKPK
jgi:spermidine/putrescine transport system permease protein